MPSEGVTWANLVSRLFRSLSSFHPRQSETVPGISHNNKLEPPKKTEEDEKSKQERQTAQKERVWVIRIIDLINDTWFQVSFQSETAKESATIGSELHLVSCFSDPIHDTNRICSTGVAALLRPLNSAPVPLSSDSEDEEEEEKLRIEKYVSY